MAQAKRKRQRSWPIAPVEKPHADAGQDYGIDTLLCRFSPFLYALARWWANRAPISYMVARPGAPVD